MIELLLIAGPIFAAASALLATPWGLPVLSWLVGSPVGRIVAIFGIVVMTLWLVFLMGRRDGIQRVELREKQRQLDALRDRIAVDQEIRRMSPEERREEFGKWVR